jgi:DNA-binding transcriptional MerR regulator
MQRFTIKDIENMCAIKAHTLRVWEQRYDFFSAQRKDSRHRYYDNDDLKKLLRIAFLYHGGWKVSKIAALGEVKITEQVLTLQEALPENSQNVLMLLEAAIDFDEARFNGLLDRVIAAKGFEECITQVCYPYLQRVGLLWMTSHIIPAQEHFSSYLIQHKIISETEKLPASSPAAPVIIVFAPQGEHHELPLLFINYLLKKWGWQTIYLGTNLELKTLPDAVKDKASHLFLHLITNFTGFEVDDYLETVCKTFPNKTIAASGRSIQLAQRRFINMILLRSDAEIQQFVSHPPTSAAHSSPRRQQ